MSSTATCQMSSMTTISEPGLLFRQILDSRSTKLPTISLDRTRKFSLASFLYSFAYLDKSCDYVLTFNSRFFANMTVILVC